MRSLAEIKADILALETSSLELEKNSAGGLIMDDDWQDIIIYNIADGKASLSFCAKDGMVWMNQNQLAKLFDTSVPNISMHISSIPKDEELD